jgi:hypothetical protein
MNSYVRYRRAVRHKGGRYAVIYSDNALLDLDGIGHDNPYEKTDPMQYTTTHQGLPGEARMWFFLLEVENRGNRRL